MEEETVDLFENWEPTSASNVISVVVVGPAGTGKSATGNSILGRQAFITTKLLLRGTSTSEMKSAILEDGRAVNVIDTPGLFDPSIGSEFIKREIGKCVDLAKDGLHAVLMVYSLRSRVTRNEVDAIQSMKALFGERIVDYMIVVITRADALKDTWKNFKESSGFPEQLKNIMRLCKNRVVLFDNKTKEKIKRDAQVNQLISLVDSIIASNGGKPFSSEMFNLVKEGALWRQEKEKAIEAKEYTEKELPEVRAEISKSFDDERKHIYEMVEQKLNSRRLQELNSVKEEYEKQLADLKAEMDAESSSTSEKIQMLMEKIQRLNDQSEKDRRQAKNKCAIL